MSNHIDDFTDHVLNHLAEQQYIRAEQTELSASDRAEYNEYIDQQWESYWSNHCPQHGEVLDSLGHCQQCEAELLEERRAEGFMSVQEANARSINNMWKIGEHLGPVD